MALNSESSRAGKPIKLPQSPCHKPAIFEKSHLPSFISPQNHQDINTGSVAIIANTVMKAIGKQLPSSQEERGDVKLMQACDLVTNEVQFIEESDFRIIEDKIT